MSALKLISSAKCFGGKQEVYSFFSAQLKCETKFSCYLPPKVVEGGEKAPVLYWLSGLTCTEENFIIKSGFQRYAAQYNVIVIGPDTSPRGAGVEGEDADWDFGTGAGFYVDATTEKYKNNYRMFSYMFDDLFPVVESQFPIVAGARAISGHSMGGHGAMIAAMKRPGFFKSVSAFAPISNPMKSAWGLKCFTGYLGEDQELWKDWDATELVKNYKGAELNLRIEQGSADEWMGHLVPDNFVQVYSQLTNKPTSSFYFLREGYNHGYYFVGTFIEEHFKHHLKYLTQ